MRPPRLANGLLHDTEYATANPFDDGEERRRKLPLSKWKGYHNLHCDPELPSGKGSKIRCWPCRQPCCVTQLNRPSV